jgi:hypothetical protein
MQLGKAVQRYRYEATLYGVGQRPLALEKFQRVQPEHELWE